MPPDLWPFRLTSLENAIKVLSALRESAAKRGPEDPALEQLDTLLLYLTDTLIALEGLYALGRLDPIVKAPAAVDADGKTTFPEAK